MLSIKRFLIEVVFTPRIVSTYFVNICLSKEEPISSISLGVDSQTGYTPLFKGLVRASTNRACISLLDPIILDPAQVQSNARE